MIISEWISQFSHLLSVAMLITMFGSMCCFARLKCQWFCNRKLFLCHKYHSGKHGAIPQERERERDASKTQLHCPSKTISQPLRASARTGGTSQTVVHRLKEHTAFFSLSGVSWTTKKENSFGDSFVVWHFPKVSNWLSPLLQFKHLCLCHSLARHLRYSCRWMGIYRCNKHRLAQMSKHAAKTHSVDKQFVGRHRHSLTHTHTWTSSYNKTLMHVQTHSLIQATFK